MSYYSKPGGTSYGCCYKRLCLSIGTYQQVEKWKNEFFWCFASAQDGKDWSFVPREGDGNSLLCSTGHRPLRAAAQKALLYNTKYCVPSLDYLEMTHSPSLSTSNNGCKSIRWSAVPVPCSSNLWLNLGNWKNSGSKRVGDQYFHTYEEFSSPPPPRSKY